MGISHKCIAWIVETYKCFQNSKAWQKLVKHPELQRIEKGALNYTRRTDLWLHPPNHSKVGAPWSTIRQHKPTAHSKNQHGRPPKLVSKCCKAAGTRNGTIETCSSEMLTISLQLQIMLSEYYNNTQLPFTMGPLLQTAGNCKPYNCRLCFQNITIIQNYHSPWALFYKQLATASPSTHLDIKKLQKRSATLLKNRACFQNTTASAGAPIFYIVQSPKKRRSRKKIFRFFCKQRQKVLTHVNFTKYSCF